MAKTVSWLPQLSKQTVVVLLLFWTMVPPAFAQVVINEVFPNPTTGQEWIELANTSPTQSVNISGWSVSDQLSSPSVLHVFTNTILEPQTYHVIKLATPKLNNGEDGVTLKDFSDQSIDQMSYESTQPDQSWAKQPDMSGPFILGAPSPNQENPPLPSPSPSPNPTPSILPSPSPSPSTSPPPQLEYQSWQSTIEIAKLLPCPDAGTPEWVELENNDTREHLLTDWFFQDESDQIRRFTLTLPAQGQAKINWNSSWLNNSGDTLTLHAPDGEQVDELGYTKCEKNVVITKNSGETPSSNDSTSHISSDSTDSPEMGPIISATNPASANPFIPPKPVAPYHPSSIALRALSTTFTQPNSSATLPPQSVTHVLMSRISRAAIGSVILGGLSLIGVSSYFLYGLYQTHSSLP